MVKWEGYEGRMAQTVSRTMKKGMPKSQLSLVWSKDSFRKLKI